MIMDTKSLAAGLAKSACVLPDVPVEMNPELQRMVGDPDDQYISNFTQFKPNPGSLQLPNPLSPIEGDEIFFAYMWPGAVFKSHDGRTGRLKPMTGQVRSRSPIAGIRAFALKFPCTMYVVPSTPGSSRFSSWFRLRLRASGTMHSPSRSSTNSFNDSIVELKAASRGGFLRFGSLYRGRHT
jgi:hypothetical protein